MQTRRGVLIAAGSGCLLAALGCTPLQLVGWSEGVLLETPFQPPQGADVDLLGHVLNRCSFGIRPGDRDSALDLAHTPEAAAHAWLESQLRAEDIDDSASRRLMRRLSTLQEPIGELYEYHEHVLLNDLVQGQTLLAMTSRRQLYEVVVQFWSDHFNIDISKAECAWLKVADEREVIRRHAFGRFSDLLRASALSPAMLWYLDGRANRAGAGLRPNENYARELLELHTLGVHGGYTQHDVMEVARCLSGWTVRPKNGLRKGAVEFSADAHDDGAKEVLGAAIPAGGGASDLDRVLELVCHHPSTARHIAAKLCRRFIADDPPSAAVAAVAAEFTASGGDIRSTLRALFRRSEFLGVEHRGTKLKRPFHFLVSAVRASDARCDAGRDTTAYLTRMGHAPFQFPTPDGYPDEAAAWRDTLMWRWNLASALCGNRIAGCSVDATALARRAGGDDGAMAHLLGRQPDERERGAWRAAGGGARGLAVLLSSPAFQRC
ncbi:MAG: DUF1800 domain-containing protein [Planctomycetes bacterium]|nr:DUF1800 domain-containing protein [Planctomycetota bacterium]